jgi:hypothetical protein
MSIACFNIRLSGISSRFWSYVNYTFLFVCFAYTMIALFLNVFKCHPAYASYNLLTIAAHSPNVPKCLSINDTNAILRLNLALDFIALAIPVILLWKVQMSWKKKGRFFGLLSIGLIACVASVMTLVSQYTLAKDPLWNYTTLLAWIMVELVVSIIAASAPTLTYLMPKSWLKTNADSNMNSGSKLSQSAHASRVSRSDLQRARVRQMNGEVSDSDEEDQGILVKSDIELKTQRLSGSGTDGRSVGSWNDDNSPQGAAGGIYDGPRYGEVRMGIAR